MHVRTHVLLLVVAVCLASFNVACCTWTQDLSRPLSQKPTDLVSVYYSMYACVAARHQHNQIFISHAMLCRPIVQIKTIDLVSSDFFTDCYL